MKKELYRASFILALIVMFVSVSPVAMAGTVGNPTAIGAKGSFLVGAEIDFWDRDFENGGTFDADGTKVLVKGTYGITNKVDVFGKIGMAEMEVDDAGWDSGYEPAIGFGGKVNVYERGQIKAGVVAQIGFWSGEDSGIDIDITEFDLAFGGSYEVTKELDCYGGLMFAMVNGDADGNDFDEADPIGIFLGGEFDITPKAKAGVELRLISETSFTLMAGFAF
jgi:hypothetical protein